MKTPSNCSGFFLRRTIAVFKQTGSIQKLQQVMGHASLAVTLGYLRGVDVPQLEVVDMPVL